MSATVCNTKRAFLISHLGPSSFFSFLSLSIRKSSFNFDVGGLALSDAVGMSGLGGHQKEFANVYLLCCYARIQNL